MKAKKPREDRRGKINKTNVDRLKPGEHISDIRYRGFVVRCLPSAAKPYGHRYTNRAGIKRWLSLGLHGQVTAEQALALFKISAGEVAAGRDPWAERQRSKAVAKNSLDFVLDEWIKRDLRARGLRSADDIERTLERLVRPVLGTRSIYSIRRRDLIEVLDAIEDRNGAPTAGVVYALLRAALNWWSTRDEEFASPIVRGMRKLKTPPRNRILNNQEIVDLVRALDELRSENPAFAIPADFVMALLYTGQRRGEVAKMHSRELTGDQWVIPADRYKTKFAHLVPLSQQALALTGGRQGFIFSTDGGQKPLSSFGRIKQMIDRKIADIRQRDGREATPRWRLHDIRRTVRSLLPRAGVTPDDAERVLGHAIGGIRGVYDHHSYAAEKADALRKLAALLDSIITTKLKEQPGRRYERRAGL